MSIRSSSTQKHVTVLKPALHILGFIKVKPLEFNYNPLTTDLSSNDVLQLRNNAYGIRPKVYIIYRIQESRSSNIELSSKRKINGSNRSKTKLPENIPATWGLRESPEKQENGSEGAKEETYGRKKDRLRQTASCLLSSLDYEMRRQRRGGVPGRVLPGCRSDSSTPCPSISGTSLVKMM